MNQTCHSDLQLHALLSEAGQERSNAAGIEHLSNCAQCRERLADLQARRNLPAFAPESIQRVGAWQRHWLPAAASIVAAVLLWQFLPQATPEPTMRSAQPSRPLQALAPTPLAENTGLRLSWGALADARGYRVGCYRGDQPAWLQRELSEPTLVIDAAGLVQAGGSVCRLDAELATGGWVLGDEQPIRP